MTEIAERAGSSIGGLYRYFPDKKALALALRNRYNAEFEALWASVIEESTHQSIADFAGDLVDRMAEFVAKRPAYFKLLAAPIQLQRDAAARSQVRTQFSEVLLAKDRSLSHEKALLIARIAIQIINGMWAVYAEFEPRRRGSIVREFKRALTAYLEDVLHSN